MQQCQDQLEFNIETPSDEEIARRYAQMQADMDILANGQRKQAPRAKFGHKTRNRKSKHTKRIERLNRDKEKANV